MRFPLLKVRKNSGFSRHLAFVLCLVILTAGFIQGCGKKADPVPFRYVAPSTITDLRLDKKEQGIELFWSSSISDGSFKILRSEQFPDEEICVDCPKNYLVISELAADDPKLNREVSGQRYSWFDTTVKAENSYSYRVVVCNASGFCSEPSNTVDAPR